MAKDYPERDWKVLRKLKDRALERFCQRIFSEMESIADQAEFSWHKRYLAIFKLIHERDDQIAVAFNNFRRSSGMMQIVEMCKLDLIQPQELDQLTPETAQHIRFLMGWEPKA